MGVRRACPTPSNLVLPVEHYAIHAYWHVTQMMYEEQTNLSDAISIITLVSFPNTTFTLIEVLWFFFHLNFAAVYFGLEQRKWNFCLFADVNFDDLNHFYFVEKVYRALSLALLTWFSFLFASLCILFTKYTLNQTLDRFSCSFKFRFLPLWRLELLQEHRLSASSHSPPWK